MSWSKGTLHLLAAVVVAMALTWPAAADEQTLLIRLPLNLDGDVSADMTRGTIALSGTSEVPRLDMIFTAAHARVLVTNFSHQEVHNMPRGFGDLVNDPQGSSEDLSPEALNDVRFEFRDLTDQFTFLLFDGTQEGATYQVDPLETPARLDVNHDPTTLSYTENPEGPDFVHTLDPNALKLSASSTRYEVRGDFNFVLHGAEMTAITPDTVTPRVKTGTWTETTNVDGGVVQQPLTTTTTTQYVRAELTDAVLTLVATGGDQKAYAHAGNMTVDVDGSIRSHGAAGSLRHNNETVRSQGEGFGATGRFQLVPIYVVPNADNKEVVFGVAGGGFDSFSIGRNTYIGNGDALAVATVSGGILGILGLAYLWKTGLLVPLYAKLTKAKVLDQATRHQIHHKVESDPGCQVKQVAEALDISWTTASYHLRVLRKMGLVVAKRQGRHEHYFAAGSPVAQSHAVVAALHNKTAKQIVETVLLNPGIIQKDLCERLGIAPSTASGHLARLRDVGALSEEREWKKRRYYAGPALQGLPVQLVGVHGVAHNDGVVSAT